jgi:hypothetical protein
LIGLFPGLHAAWIFTALTGIAALGLVGLMAYAKEVQEEQRRRRARTERRVREHVAARESVDAATAGHPGAWDDDFAEARVAAR